MIPEPTKMNWSSVKPSFEEVEGKRVHIEYRDGAHGTANINDAGVHTAYFDNSFIRYAIIDTEPEPMEYKGKLPDVCGNEKFYLCWSDDDGAENYDTPYFSTKSEAIEYWNKFVKAMEAK